MLLILKYYKVIFLLALALLILLIFSVLIQQGARFSYNAVIDEINESTLGIKEKETLPLRLTILGDVMLARNVENLMLSKGADYPFQHFSEIVGSSTQTLVNFESAVAVNHSHTVGGAMTFSVPTTSIPALFNSGVKFASLANNHTLDYGNSGYLNARAALAAENITGFGHPTKVSSSSITYIKDGDFTLGVLAVHTLFVNPDLEEIQKLFEELNKNSDLQMVYVHWGDEYKPVHNKAQEILARKLISFGFDIIVGHHPHVVQDIQLIDGKPVFYSLGNTVFDQYFSREVQIGLALQMIVEPEYFTIDLIPLDSRQSRSQPNLMSEEEVETFLTELAGVSDETLLEGIKNGSLQFQY